MSVLHTSGLTTDSIVDEAEISWAHVKRLCVQDLNGHKGNAVEFVATVVWKDDTCSYLKGTSNIDAARQACARLSAIHDIPVQDWTRPAPPTLSVEAMVYSLKAAGVPVAEQYPSVDVPEEEPQWGSGWTSTDALFLEGATLLDLCESLDAISRSMRHSWTGSFTTRVEELERAIDINRDEALRRWLMLEAANTGRIRASESS